MELGFGLFQQALGQFKQIPSKSTVYGAGWYLGSAKLVQSVCWRLCQELSALWKQQQGGRRRAEGSEASCLTSVLAPPLPAS